MKRSGGTRGYVRGLWISIAFVAVACLGARPARVSGSEIIDFPVESYSLANGMRVVTERSPDYGTSGVVLLVRAGSANEPAGKAGLAHLTEHLVFRAHHDGEDSLFSRLAQLGGGAFNGYTDWTSTVYFAFVPEQNQERLLDTLQSVLSDPLAGIDERAFTHELQIVNTERQLRTENGTPGEALGHLARATFPTDHPYAHPVAGTPESLESLTLDDVRDFVKKYYRPAKCILVSVAPATTSKQRAAVDQRFDLEATSTGISRPAARPDVPPVPGGPPLHEARSLDANPKLWVGWSVPPTFGSEGDFPELVVSMLNGAFFANVRERVRDITKVDAGYIGGGSTALLYLEASLEVGDDPEAVFDSLIRGVGRGLVERTHDATTFEAYKRHVATTQTYASEFQVSRAIQMAVSEHFTGRADYLMERGNRLLNINEDGLEAYYEKYLTKERARAVLVRPDPARDAPDFIGQPPSDLTDDWRSKTPVPKLRPSWMRPLGIKQAEQRTLSNGLNLVVLPRYGSPFHTALLGFRGGSADADKAGAGEASSWAKTHRSFAPSVRGRMFEDRMSEDATWQMVRSTGSNIDGTLEALREEVSGFSIRWPPPQFTAQLETFEQLERFPRQRLYRARKAALLGDHAYARVPEVQQIKSVTASDIYRLFAKIRQPKNAVLVITGNVSVAEAVAAAERHMGNWHASGLANRTLPAPAALTPTRVPERTLLQDWPGSSQAEIHMDCALQPIAGPRDLAVAEVLTETLGAAFLTELRGGKAGAYNVSTDLEYLRGGTTLVSVSTQVGYAAAAQVVDHFRSFLAGSTHYLEAASVDAAQSRLARSYNLSQATSALVAQHVFDAYKQGWPLEWLDQYPDDLASVSQEFVVEAAAACRRHALISVLGDRSRLGRVSP